MTLRQIQVAIKRIQVRTLAQRRFEAQLHGVQLKIPEGAEADEPAPDLTPEEEAMIERDLQARMRKRNDV